ncbi:F-box/FBD/LRR-repeat protein [Spatholobus suberectus]|nr:F-box/FBD/LRR-repeat protein [Spatholobus suberectus]
MRNQQRKKQRVVKCNQEDYISGLPNSILCHILSSLTVREAVKTSVLSSKWRKIYDNPTNLILDADNMLKIDHSATNVRNRTSAVVSNVKQYLSHVGQVHKIDKLKVCFTFGHDGCGSTDLDEWIRFAIERNVEEIDLCLWEGDHLSAPNDGSLHVFPCDIVGNEGACAGASGLKSFLKCLRLAYCVLAPHKCYTSGFSTLSTLELFRVDLKSKLHIQTLLASCSNLEWLGFSECYNVDDLIIKHPFCQKLKFLSVNLCRQLTALVLHSTSLETLEYMGSKIEFAFNAPRLKSFYSRVSDSTACHREVWPVFRLPIDLPQLETFILECSCYMGEVMTNILPAFTFPSLRHLEVIKVATLRQDLWWVVGILKSCPILGRLELHLRTYFCIDEELRKRGWPNKIPHNHLKEVVITGIRGHSSEIEIAIYLLRNAIALEKMTIDPRPKIYLGKGKWDHKEDCENWSREVRQKVHRLLKQEANSAVKLLIK